MQSQTHHIALTVKSLGSFEANQFQRATVEVEMTEAQLAEAIDALLDAGGPEKRAQRMAQLTENEANGMHA